jgi:transcriptional regulator with XRE-family HTH domain
VPKSTFTDAYKELLQVLLTTRRDAGVTQMELAKRLGKPQSWVSNVEKGVRRVDVIEFYAIARALGADPVALLSTFMVKLPKRVRI